MGAVRPAEIIFVGGAHATGKSTICRALAGCLGAQHLKASELVAFRPLEKEQTGKAVENVVAAQERLVRALQERTSAGGRFLLDGHFALIASDGGAEAVPLATFQSIGPKAIVLLEASPERITKRMATRDGTTIPAELLQDLMDLEHTRALYVARALGCALVRCTPHTDEDEVLGLLAVHLGDE